VPPKPEVLAAEASVMAVALPARWAMAATARLPWRMGST
jgi:hypothetical protein